MLICLFLDEGGLEQHVPVVDWSTMNTVKRYENEDVIYITNSMYVTPTLCVTIDSLQTLITAFTESPIEHNNIVCNGCDSPIYGR